MINFLTKNKRILFTQKGYNDVLLEKEKLLSQRPQILENLRKARELGDLSENGFYKETRQRLSFLDSRLRFLEKLVRLGKVVEKKSFVQIDIGNKVMINDGKKDFVYTLVGSFESNPQKKTISHLSPLGKALMGKKVKEKISVQTPKGEVFYTIIKIS